MLERDEGTTRQAKSISHGKPVCPTLAKLSCVWWIKELYELVCMCKYVNMNAFVVQ